MLVDIGLGTTCTAWALGGPVANIVETSVATVDEAANPVFLSLREITALMPGRSCPERVALVTLGDAGRTATLILDHEWIELASQARDVDASLLDDFELPAAAVVAVVPGRPSQWRSFDVADIRWSADPDGVLVISGRPEDTDRSVAVDPHQS